MSAIPPIKHTIVLEAPIERVWRVASDFNGLPAWMPGMKDDGDVLPETWIRVATRF